MKRAKEANVKYFSKKERKEFAKLITAHALATVYDNGLLQRGIIISNGEVIGIEKSRA